MNCSWSPELSMWGTNGTEQWPAVVPHLETSARSASDGLLHLVHESVFGIFVFVVFFRLPLCKQATVATVTADESWWATDSWQSAVRGICHTDTRLRCFHRRPACFSSFSEETSAPCSSSSSTQRPHQQTHVGICGTTIEVFRHLYFTEMRQRRVNG